MITEQTYQAEEAKISSVFKQAGWHTPEKVDFARIERISERVVFQNLMKDTAKFTFMSFGIAINGVVGAALGCVVCNAESDYKA